MASTAVEIASNALIRLGADPINAFTDGVTPTGNKHGQIAGNLWPSVRDQLLRSHPWNCAVKRVQLNPDATAPSFTYTNRFLLPGDFLRVLDINDLNRQHIDFRVENGYILCNQALLKLRYIFRNENIATWDSYLTYVAELSMAVAMAYPVTESSTFRAELKNELEFELKKARAVDGQEEPGQTLGDFPLLDARYAGSAYWLDARRGD